MSASRRRSPRRQRESRRHGHSDDRQQRSERDGRSEMPHKRVSRKDVEDVSGKEEGQWQDGKQKQNGASTSRDQNRCEISSEIQARRKWKTSVSRVR